MEKRNIEELIKKLNGRRIVASVSGGKDSAALSKTELNMIVYSWIQAGSIRLLMNTCVDH